jgi:hypothetical protein
MATARTDGQKAEDRQKCVRNRDRACVATGVGDSLRGAAFSTLVGVRAQWSLALHLACTGLRLVRACDPPSRILVMWSTWMASVAKIGARQMPQNK